jgi:hypothetical protein
MTRSGTAYQLRPSAPLTGAIAFGSLPTPAATDYGSSQNGTNSDRPSAGSPSLETMARHGEWPRLPTPRPCSGLRSSGLNRTEMLDALEKWPTPVASDADRSTDYYPRGNPTLLGAARDRQVPTPTVADSRGSRRETARTEEWESKEGRTLCDFVELWPTPTVQDASNDGGPAQFERNSLPLNAAVKLWPTPKASRSGPDYKRAERPGSGTDDLATAVARETRGQLNPAWVEWLMGFPVGWTDLPASAMPSSRRSRRSSASGSSRTKRKP